jgi:hypothetical protein
MDDDLEPYLKSPVARALAKDRYLLEKRRVPPVPRDAKGRIMPGFSGNLHGRPPGRASMRVAFHRYGLNGLAKLNALADDPTLSPGQRAVIYAEQVRLAYSLRAIRSDASAQRKLEQQQRERELHEATLAVLQRAGVPAREFMEWLAAKSKPGTPPASPLPAPCNEATPPPVERPPARDLPEAPGGEAKAQADGDGNAQPGAVPRRPFRICLPA